MPEDEIARNKTSPGMIDHNAAIRSCIGLQLIARTCSKSRQMNALLKRSASYQVV